jgi:hypothetical protein
MKFTRLSLNLPTRDGSDQLCYRGVRPCCFNARSLVNYVCVCVDYRALNHATAKYAYPMPLIDELLEKLQSCQVVSKLDLSEGFHQIRVAPEAVYKTAFVSHYGACENLFMPFGLANAPAQFTLLMNNVLKGIEKTILQSIDCFVVFMDDILVYSKSLEDHHATCSCGS